MQNQEVRNLVLSLTSDSPFVEEIRQHHFPKKKVLSPSECLVYPMRNPRFEFDFVDVYARSEQLLPPQVVSPSMWRLYSHLRYCEEIKYTDPAGCEALALADGSNRAAQALVEGLLCSGLNCKEVARLCGRSVKVIELYASWLFDFIARRDDRTFVVSVLNPEAELGLIRTEDAPDSLLLARRLGYNLGPEAVVKEIGLWVERNSCATGDRTANTKRVLLSDAETKAKMGLLHTDDAGFATFNSLLKAEAKRPPTTEREERLMGLSRISSDEACQLVIRQITERGARAKLEATRAYDAQQAAEVAKTAVEKSAA
jgi:hypothetical protein